MEIAIGKCGCPHVYEKDGKLFVTYSSGGDIYRYDTVTKTRTKLCSGDEYLPVGNGRFLLRNGQNYTITEDIL